VKVDKLGEKLKLFKKMKESFHRKGTKNEKYKKCRRRIFFLKNS